MTQEQFIKILPAYMGCKVQNYGLSLTGRVHSVDINGFCCVDWQQFVPTRHHFSTIKLILRTFDQMTDEESTRFRQLADEADKHSYALWAMNATKAVNYLRSIGIDCDRLIEAGYAIKEDSE